MIFEGALVRDDRDYEYWYGYSNDSLTKLCVAFNLPRSGTKKDKAARLCFAWELGYEPKGSDDEAKIVEEERQMKLLLSGITIPDPPKIDACHWKRGPPTNLSIFERRNIVDYYMKNPFIAPVGVNDLNKYTSTVAYTLWKDGRVCGIKCYECANCVIVSAKCRSTMLTNEYDVWVAMDQSTAEIHTGYCSCIAGLPGYCKHLFAMLFSLEFYSDTDESSPSCTSLPQQWGQPSSAISSVPPTPAGQLTLRKATLDHEPKTALSTPVKTHFETTVPEMSSEDQADLVQKMAAEFSDCALVKVESTINARSTVRTLQSILLEWKGKTDTTLDDKIRGCFDEIRSYFNAIKAVEIEKETRQQSQNPLWSAHRVYRITASIAGDILAAVKRFEDAYIKLSSGGKSAHRDYREYFHSLDSEEREKALGRLLPPSRLARLEGAQYDGPATRYGRFSEETALKEYLHQHKEAGCDDVLLERACGLFVNPEWPYLGASLDGVITCSKHGRRIVEVKCPYRCDVSLPESKRQQLLDILELNSETGGLARNPHFWQQVVQMALANIHCSDLYIWSKNESFLETVQFDQSRWDEAVTRLEWYFRCVILSNVLS